MTPARITATVIIAAVVFVGWVVVAVDAALAADGRTMR